MQSLTHTGVIDFRMIIIVQAGEGKFIIPRSCFLSAAQASSHEVIGEVTVIVHRIAEDVLVRVRAKAAVAEAKYRRGSRSHQGW